MGRPAILLAKDIYYPVLAIVGIPANVATIVILCRGRCGLSQCVTVYMIAMATAGLLVLVFSGVFDDIFSYHFPGSFLMYTPVCKFILFMNYCLLEMLVWFTVSFTFDRFVAICCRGFKEKFCTKRNATAVVVILTLLSTSKSFPMFFMLQHQVITNNVPHGCRPSDRSYTDPGWEVYRWFTSCSIFFLPFTFMLQFNSLTVRRILLANRARRGLRVDTSHNQNDPELKNRRISIVFLFSVSLSFMLLWLTAVVTYIMTRLFSSRFQPDYSNPAYIATETGYILMYLSCCSNCCIYAVTQKKFREELQIVLKSPFTFIFQLGKQ